MNGNIWLRAKLCTHRSHSFKSITVIMFTDSSIKLPLSFLGLGTICPVFNNTKVLMLSPQVQMNQCQSEIMVSSPVLV